MKVFHKVLEGCNRYCDRYVYIDALTYIIYIYMTLFVQHIEIEKLKKWYILYFYANLFEFQLIQRNYFTIALPR